jgi:predicted DNA-binding ribbon-helix-helix protein
MVPLNLLLREDLVKRLEEIAAERGISIDTLISAFLADRIGTHGDFESTVRKVMAKNAELYRRLA